jgi:hypothetical protein
MDSLTKVKNLAPFEESGFGKKGKALFSCPYFCKKSLEAKVNILLVDDQRKNFLVSQAILGT